MLKDLDYEKHGQEVEFTGLKRKMKLTRADQERGIKLFSICNHTQTRTFMKNVWTGMTLQDNEYYPLGYAFNNLNDYNKHD